MSTETMLHTGQQQARTRWNTHESGAAFDRKKLPYLSQQAQEFISQQAMCVITGLTLHNTLDGLLVLDQPGFIQILDASTCLLRLHDLGRAASILWGLHHALSSGRVAWLSLFFLSHPTRERLCVHATVEMLSSYASSLSGSSPSVVVRLHIQEAFFHCSKYIRTRVPGLTTPASPADITEEHTFSQEWLRGNQKALSEEHCHFLRQQVLCYLCTVNREGRCAINHRGGAPGFLVPYLPTLATPGGILLLPDYAGNGAFEALGNILETKQASIIVPNYVDQIALCVSGAAYIMEAAELHPEVARLCRGAERVVALAVQHIGIQRGDWSASLAYEYTHAASLWATHRSATCALT